MDGSHCDRSFPFLAGMTTLLKARRGRHKVFIGMAPGVGKTYRMLQEGQQLHSEGLDVVIGLLETHGRQETRQQAQGLELVAPRQLDYNGVVLSEVDIEAILQRQPQLVLIDELAHTNAPGSEHEKRYQDVELLLAAGLDVYSTVNIQHLESLNDLVARITGVIVRERIPDRLLEEADEVVVVDVTPETLEERLREGRIYALDKVPQALTNFFRRHHLVALRELALRSVADSIEEQAAGTRTGAISVRERVLVCLSTHPQSIRLLRRAARLSGAMDARLYVLFVADPQRFLTKAEVLQLETCDRLCGMFEGAFLRVESTDVVGAIVKVATEQRVTQVVIGESPTSRRLWWWQRPLTDRLLQRLRGQGIDLHIISFPGDHPDSELDD
ncbi:two-component system, OmpR family, sensor histidine kinase KdpD [Synechococcus elongatus PCC 6311]|nr:two-component system, OmpR family, sensor histidine kinase KdpD [Synechococcus elongatus PCC 6311]UOW76992.1 two-component system, OmpR family, sensor histidine kinase KdpD [Synechococcus elongatus PCC 6301]BAD80552.1 potassium-transporting ATPase D chain [Synechococcus elongatus PCC 6301]